MISDILTLINCINTLEPNLLYICFRRVRIQFFLHEKRIVRPFKLLQKNETIQDALMIALEEINYLDQDNTEIL